MFYILCSTAVLMHWYIFIGSGLWAWVIRKKILKNKKYEMWQVWFCLWLRPSQHETVRCEISCRRLEILESDANLKSCFWAQFRVYIKMEMQNVDQVSVCTFLMNQNCVCCCSLHKLKIPSRDQDVSVGPNSRKGCKQWWRCPGCLSQSKMVFIHLLWTTQAAKLVSCIPT